MNERRKERPNRRTRGEAQAVQLDNGDAEMMILLLLCTALNLLAWKITIRQPLRSDDDLDAGQW